MTAPRPATIEREKAILTIEEVAAELHVPAGWLGRWLGKHPRDNRDRPLYRVACRKKLFTPQQVQLVIEALPCPSKSSSPEKAEVPSGTSEERSPVDLLTRQRRRETKKVLRDLRLVSK